MFLFLTNNTHSTTETNCTRRLVLLFVATGCRIQPNNISDSYYEAADIDGASNFEKFKYITLPLVKPTTFYLLITGVIGGLQSYTDAVVFAEGHEGTRTIVWYIWNYGINNSRYGYASAVSAFLAVVIMIITIIQFKKTKMLDI